ncbi:MAG: alanine racemase [Oscillospiraceae bacterium]|nr:alanine racemase [Oscillospiraceae bacterium]
MESTLKRTWAEIDLDALAHNYHALRKQMGPDSRFLGVVKADAYGHGSIEASRTLEALGAEYLAVSNVEEARELRDAGITLPVLQLGLTPPDQTNVILDNQITQNVWSEPAARAFSGAAVQAGGRMKVHIKLDTGMSRLGFQCDPDHFDASLEAIARVFALPGLDIEGVFTHFAVSDESSDASRDYTLMQYERFQAMTGRLEERGLHFRIRHCANSGATVSYPQFACGMFRPGIIMYGIGHQADSLGLRPVMTLKTVIGAVKEYAPDTTVSYGRTFRAERPSRVGVLPIGYADGLHRMLSNKWRVRTSEGFAPLIGRICMDMCMIDLTDLPDVKEGDEVEVYGPHNSVNDAARLAETISYELTCAVSKRVPRIYYQNGKEISRELLLRG